MTCVRDMVFHVLFGADRGLTEFYVRQSMQRLGAEWDDADLEPDVFKTHFFLLMDRDMALKEAALQGIPRHGVEPMADRKAENFFLSMREEVIEPWLSDERMGPERFLDMISSLYWAC